MTSRSSVFLASALAAAVVASDGRMQAQTPAPSSTARASAAAAAIRVLPVRGNVYMLLGAGINVAASVGKDGVVVVDSGSASSSERLLTSLRELSAHVTSVTAPLQSCAGRPTGCAWWGSSQFLPSTAAPPAPRPIIGIINTSGLPDHVGGNARLSQAGRSFGVRNANNVSAAWIVAHENVAREMAEAKPAPQPEAMPTEGYFGSEKKLNYLNGEPVVITYRPASATDADSIVFFRTSDVLVAGEILDMSGYPMIDVAHGGTINGLIDSLNWILDVTVVEHMMEGGTMVVPARGRLADAADVAYYRDMMTIFRDRVQHLVEKGLSLAQIQAARPTRDYDGRFGKKPGWTPNQLVEAIHKTLPKS